MIIIKRVYTEDHGRWIRLCADIEINDKSTTMWFAVELSYAPYLVTERSDAFVAALAYAAVKTGEDIKSEIPVSALLLHQLNAFLFPTLAKVFGKRRIYVHAAPEAAVLKGKKAVGVGYSGGVDCFYTIMKHSPAQIKRDKASYRQAIDYLCVFNVGVFEGNDIQGTFARAVAKTEDLAQEIGLKVFSVDSNLPLVLPEQYLESYIYRLEATVLAVQKLFGTYLISAGVAPDQFRIEYDNGDADLLSTEIFSTETTKFYSAGGGVLRVQKIKALTEYPPCYSRLHPCFVKADHNCGHCKKCRRDTVTLWAYGKLELFRDCYDVDFALKNLDINIAFLMANSSAPLYGEVLELLQKKNIEIPARSRLLAGQFAKGLERLKQNEAGKK